MKCLKIYVSMKLRAHFRSSEPGFYYCFIYVTNEVKSTHYQDRWKRFHNIFISGLDSWVIWCVITIGNNMFYCKWIEIFIYVTNKVKSTDHQDCWKKIPNIFISGLDFTSDLVWSCYGAFIYYVFTLKYNF